MTCVILNVKDDRRVTRGTASPVGSSQADKAASHERIVKAASRRIRRDGIDNVGVAELMKQAGLTHGGFYRHFDSRDDLVAEAIVEALAQGSQRVRASAKLERTGRTCGHRRRVPQSAPSRQAGNWMCGGRASDRRCTVWPARPGGLFTPGARLPRATDRSDAGPRSRPGASDSRLARRSAPAGASGRRPRSVRRDPREGRPCATRATSTTRGKPDATASRQSCHAAAQPDVVRVAAGEARRTRRGAHGRRRRRALSGRRSRLPVHRDHRGRGRDPRRRRQRDRPPRGVGLPRRAEPALRARRCSSRRSSPSRCATSPSTARCCARSCTRTARSATSSCRPSSPGAKGSSGSRGIGLEIVGPHSSKATMRMLDFARSNRLPLTWRDPEHGG